MKGWIAGTLLAVLAAVAVGAGTLAQEEPPDPAPEPATETTANVEVRVWQDVRDALRIYISARPEDGSWATLGTIPLPLDDGHSSNGRFRYGDIVVAVPVGSGESDVEVRVWQDVRDALSVYISARPEGGSWATLGTIPLPLDDGHSSSGRFRYGDITVEVPVPLPWVDPRPADTYTLAELADMPAPRAPEAPPKPEHVMAFEFEAALGYIKPFLVDASRVAAVFSHAYDSRKYPVVCEDLPSNKNTEIRDCKYRDTAPLDQSGTRRLEFNDGWYDSENEGISFVSASLDGVQLVCESRPPRWYLPFWWCYDPDTYRAWEAARDRALAPPDDPLERYLRQQGDPPLWYDDPPFKGEGTGDYTTGVFRIEPYVTYEYEWVWDGDWVGESLPLFPYLTCAPVDRNGRAEISADALNSEWLEGGRRGFMQGDFYKRSTMLCEIRITIIIEGPWTIDLAQADNP